MDARTAAQGAEVVPVVVCAADILKGARAGGGAHRCQNAAEVVPVVVVLMDARTAAEVVPVVVSAADILKAKTLYIYKVINI